MCDVPFIFSDHVHYGLTLLNRWASGEPNPWADADWAASWQRGTITEQQWRLLRDNLRREAEAWRKAVHERTDWLDISAAGALASAAHTAYHLGAIRQILAAMGKHAGWSQKNRTGLIIVMALK